MEAGCVQQVPGRGIGDSEHVCVQGSVPGNTLHAAFRWAPACPGGGVHVWAAAQAEKDTENQM